MPWSRMSKRACISLDHSPNLLSARITSGCLPKRPRTDNSPLPSLDCFPSTACRKYLARSSSKVSGGGKPCSNMLGLTVGSRPIAELRRMTSSSLSTGLTTSTSFCTSRVRLTKRKQLRLIRPLSGSMDSRIMPRLLVASLLLWSW